MEQFPDSLRIGMTVFDSEHHEIGTIDNMKYPENAVAPDIEPAGLDATDNRPDNILDTMADIFGRDELPEPVREQLLREGYIHLDASGIFAANRYIRPEQISRVLPDGVQLNVTRDALIKGD